MFERIGQGSTRGANGGEAGADSSLSPLRRAQLHRLQIRRKAKPGAEAGPAEAGAEAGPAEAGAEAGPAEAGAEAGPAEAGAEAGPAEAGADEEGVEVSKPEDAAEKEADAVADDVADGLHGDKKDEKKRDKKKKKKPGAGADSEKDESEKDDSEKDDSEKDDSEKDDSEKDDSEKDDSEKDDSEKDDSEKDDGPEARPAAPIQAKADPGIKVHLKGPDLPPNPKKAEILSVDKILGDTLSSFESYAASQVDWHKDPTIKGDEHKNLRKLLEFARSGSILTGCGGMNVRELLDSHLTSDVKKQLGSYADAVGGAVPTVEILSTDKLDQALKQGKALDRLNSTVGGAMMKHIMKKEKLDTFIDDGHVEPFISYVKQSHPILSAEGEPSAKKKDEIWSFQELHKGGDPNRYKGVIKHVRNMHHFENDALETLKMNEPQKNDPNAGGKPFNLILHSGLDHNAAFHHDPNMTKAIQTDFTILVEGVKSIGEIKDQLKDLAGQYGGGKINQVMICGHGGPTGMQLAGDVAVEGDEVKEKKDSLEIKQDPKNPEEAKKKQEQTDAFLNELLANMSNDPKDPGRIVLNACLTAALPNQKDLPADKDEAKKTILANPSLAQHLQDLADKKKDDKGDPMKVDVKGSNASFGAVSLNDPANKKKFDIVDESGNADLLTSSKLEYVEKGIEPEGAIRAVLQAWAEDQGKCLAAIDKRLAVSKDHGWAETYIRTMYNLVKAEPDNAAQINTLCTKIRNFADAYAESECKVAKLWPADADYAAKIFPALATTNEWTTMNHVPLVFNQKWMEFDNSKKADFLTALVNYGTTGAAAKFVDSDFLAGQNVPDLIGSAKAPSKAQVRLAFILAKKSNDDAKKFVKELVDANGGKLTPYKDDLTNLSNEPEMVKLVSPKDDKPKNPADEAEKPKDANADLDDDGNNETRVEPLCKDGRAKVAVHVRKGPSLEAKIIRTIYPGDRVAIIGKKDDWYAVEDGKSTAFIFAKYVAIT